MRAALAFSLLLLAAPVGAVEAYHVALDGATVDPPVTTSCAGSGTVTLGDDGVTLSYEIHFTNWVNDEFAAHIHELNLPPQTGEHILEDIALGPDKIGSIQLADVDVDALHQGRLFVLVHTTTHPRGEVKGWIVPAVAAFPQTWGGLKAIYR